jgi:virginiamycin B lyase
MGGPGVSNSSGLWIASEQRNQLIQFTANGGASPIDLPPQPAGNFPQGVAAASDGSIWISEINSVLRVGSDRQVTSFAVQGQPNGRIVQGPDKAIWVTELGKDRVARIMNEQVHEFSLPSAPVQVQCGGRCPYGIASGPDGNLWITESQLAAGGLVGRMTLQGEYKNWPLREAGAALNDITAGPDQALWFGESRARGLGRVTTEGVVTEQVVDLPTHASGTELVSAGGGLIWYAPSLAPTSSEDPIAVGAALPSGASRIYEIAGTKGPVAAVVPMPAPEGLVVDVVTWSGQIWQGSMS